MDEGQAQRSRRTPAVPRRLGYSLVALAVIVSTASAALLAFGETIDIIIEPRVWYAIWISNLVLIALLIALVLTEGLWVLRELRTETEGSQSKAHIALVFCSVTFVTTVLVTGIVAVSFYSTTNQPFSRIVSMIENSLVVARSYLAEQNAILDDDAEWLAESINEVHDLYMIDRDGFEVHLTELALLRSVPFVVMVNRDGEILAAAQSNIEGINLPELTTGLSQTASLSSVALELSPERSLRGRIVRLSAFADASLVTIRAVNPSALSSIQSSIENLAAIERNDAQRPLVFITFGLGYAGVALVFLLSAIWLGTALARQFGEPIQELLVATHQVSRGDLYVAVSVPRRDDELGRLVENFNAMTTKLREQRNVLIARNNAFIQRGNLTSAVIEGVSAGVVGIDETGIIQLINKRGCLAANVDERDAVGRHLSAIFPALSDALNTALTRRTPVVLRQIEVTGDQEHIYSARITRQGSLTDSTGFIVTLHEVTELITAQRSGAWAEVARRIAHEIKNPLTPIHLSTERLKRRYSTKLSDDLTVFERCTATIVKHVDIISQMVDEFASFARMPSPKLVEGDLAQTVREAIFTVRLKYPELDVQLVGPDRPIIMMFDQRLVSMGIQGLLGYACDNIGRRSASDNKVTLRVGHQDEIARVLVEDNGVGWLEGGREQFEGPFISRENGRASLQLPTLARVVEQHGGRLELMRPRKHLDGTIGAVLAVLLPMPEGGTGIDELAQRTC